MMIDLHAHILPGVDDGSQSLEMSLEMARLAVASGVQHMALTPHCNLPDNARTNYDTPELRARMDQLQLALERESIPLELYTGCEVFSTEETPLLLRRKKLISLNDGKYLLVEFGFGEDVDFVFFILEAILDEGYIPLVAHPERYHFVVHDPSLTYEWVRMGCALQVNRGSVLGRFGKSVRDTAWSLLDHQVVACVATDCHRSEFRTPHMTDVKDALGEAYGPECPRLLLEDNPARILQSQPVAGLRPVPFRRRRW
ncbi:MAG: hypothetical protein LUF81_03275 [Clostridiales bacterium]|nr:hypothetical protein [Clostridiales bacterium]